MSSWAKLLNSYSASSPMSKNRYCPFLPRSMNGYCPSPPRCINGYCPPPLKSINGYFPSPPKSINRYCPSPHKGIITRVIYIGKSRNRVSSINSRRRIFNTLICRIKETVAALGRTDDIQVNKIEMSSFLIPNWLKKTLKFPSF